jgi:hypothetical protein
VSKKVSFKQKHVAGDRGQSRNMVTTLSDRELAAVLVGLRLFKRQRWVIMNLTAFLGGGDVYAEVRQALAELATNSGEFLALSDAEIDALFHRLCAR